MEYNKEYRTHYVAGLSSSMAGQQIKVAGWVHEIRNIGSVVFLLLRDHTGIVQVTAKKGAVSEAVIASMFLQKESVVSISGTLTQNSEARKGFEIIPSEVLNLNPITKGIPFEVTGKVPAELDVRLNNRHIDLRRRESTAVFNIQSTLLRAFRETLIAEGFMEIRTPSLVKEATEGGSDLFKVDYFGESAYLAQSPQLYKQLAVIGGLDRVFMIAPVFRAEKSNTTTHINEITQMDIEMGFADHNDAIRLLGRTVGRMIGEVIKSNGSDLETLGVKLSSTETKEVTYSEACERLRASGSRIEFGQDFSRDDEQRLAVMYGDMLIVKGYPTKVRAFYSMPSAENPELSNSYDFIYKGIEIASGAQRIHKAELIESALRSRGASPDAFEFYIGAFRQGAPPHAGWSIGLERLTMKITGMENVRECSMFPRDRNRLVP